MRTISDKITRRLEMEDFFSIEIDTGTGTADLLFTDKYFHIGGDVTPHELLGLIDALKTTIEILDPNIKIS
jgi:hypothetical protein